MMHVYFYVCVGECVAVCVAVCVVVCKSGQASKS